VQQQPRYDRPAAAEQQANIDEGTQQTNKETSRSWNSSRATIVPPPPSALVSMKGHNKQATRCTTRRGIRGRDGIKSVEKGEEKIYARPSPEVTLTMMIMMMISAQFVYVLRPSLAAVFFVAVR
jgi:hypothetical protein